MAAVGSYTKVAVFFYFNLVFYVYLIIYSRRKYTFGYLCTLFGKSI